MVSFFCCLFYIRFQIKEEPRPESLGFIYASISFT